MGHRPEAQPLYRQLLSLVKDKDYFVITTNVDGQFEKAGFDTQRIFATQGDYAFFQPADGSPKELYPNQQWVEQALPTIHDCRLPTEMIPHTPDGKPVAMNLRCDDTFVEDEHWHEQADRYSQFIEKSYDKRLLLLEFGVGFNTSVIIRFPFERMAAQFPQTSLVRFNRDYPQLMTAAAANHFTAFTEDVTTILRNIQS